MRKFYHTLNSTKPAKSNGLLIQFVGYRSPGGNWLGVFETEDPKEQAALDKLVKDPRSGITSMTEAEYDAALKKKPAVKGYSPIFDPRLPIQSQVIESNRAAERVGEATVPKVIPTAAVASVNDTIEVGEVTPSEAPSVKPQRKRRKQ